jgi:GDP-mannose transporter
MLMVKMKSLQYMTIPVFTIFKNMAVIVVAYGEKLTFGTSVTGFMLMSFGLMVQLRYVMRQ